MAIGSKLCNCINFSGDDKIIYEKLMFKTKCDQQLTENIDIGHVMVPGSHLPSNTNKPKSFISGRLIEVKKIKS